MDMPVLGSKGLRAGPFGFKVSRPLGVDLLLLVLVVVAPNETPVLHHRRSAMVCLHARVSTELCRK